MATQNTEWPTHTIRYAVKQLLELLFQLITEKTREVGIRLSQLFTVDAFLETNTRKFTGQKEIQNSRKEAWTHIKSRKYEIKKVYTACPAGDDLLMLGRIYAELWNGQRIENEFCARVVVDDSGSDFPRVRSFRLADLC